MNQPERYTATMILDSMSFEGIRISTIHVTMPRFILAEANTHRAFSRNARSTRAVPTSKLIAEVRNNPFVPLKWLKNKPGMQATEPMSEVEIIAAEADWRQAARNAADHAERQFERGLHKQWAGRGLEPYLFTDWLVTATEWGNFMALRDDEAAQPEFQLVAQRIRDCLDASKPEFRRPDEWHLPYCMTPEERAGITAYGAANLDVFSCGKEQWYELARKVSAARCARLSYAPFDGSGSIEAEVARYDKLVGSQPVHASPTEHQATPDRMCRDRAADMSMWEQPHKHGNFTGWIQARKLIPNETVRWMPARCSA